MDYPKVPTKRNKDDLLTTVESDINAPMEIVFDVLTDFELFAELDGPVKKVITDPNTVKGKGYQSHWKLEDPGTGDKWELDEEILHYDRPRQYAYSGHGTNGKDYTGVHNLSRNPDGSTHHHFNEVHHFIADPAVYGKSQKGLSDKVKKEAEKRYNTGK